jgi:hypothetical protein
MKTLKYALTVAAALALTAVNMRAGQTASPVLGVLSGVTAMELPTKAALLVSQADAKNLKATTIDVVKTAVGLNPAAAAPVVGSIAQQTPEMAPTAAATAVSLVPDGGGSRSERRQGHFNGHFHGHSRSERSHRANRRSQPGKCFLGEFSAGTNQFADSGGNVADLGAIHSRCTHVGTGDGWSAFCSSPCVS